ncbi:hypothetical protein [Spirosoma fluminis]
MNDSTKYQSSTWVSTDRRLPVYFLLLLGGSLVANCLTEHSCQQQLTTERAAQSFFGVKSPPGGDWAYQPLLPQTEAGSRGWRLIYNEFPYP